MMSQLSAQKYLTLSSLASQAVATSHTFNKLNIDPPFTELSPKSLTKFNKHYVLVDPPFL